MMERMAATDIWLKRLRTSADLDEDDERHLRELPLTLKRMEGNQDIVGTGDRPSMCCLVVEGFVLRAKAVAEGKRQILAFHQPGDVPDLQSLYLHVMDHDVTTLGDCVLGFIPHGPLRELVRKRPNIAEVLWRDTLIDAAIFREWICNVGPRSGLTRMAHLMLEIYTRLKAIGRAQGNSFRLPLTQALLGEAIGMSTVHVNRILQQLRGEGLLDFGNGVVTIYDEAKLMKVGDFDPLYLHLDPAL